MLNIKLTTRTADHVVEFWNRTQDDEIRKVFPLVNHTLQEALQLFEKSLSTDATSYGKAILFEGRHVGDIWCYSIDEKNEKMAMLSILLFDKTVWGKGIATEAMKAFIEEIFNKYNIEKIGAFTYSHNHGSIGLLKKTGFVEMETFVENGMESKYFELRRV